jgi:hypothetical protein
MWQMLAIVIAGMGKTTLIEFSLRNLRERDHLGDLCICGRILIQYRNGVTECKLDSSRSDWLIGSCGSILYGTYIRTYMHAYTHAYAHAQMNTNTYLLQSMDL